MSSVNELKKYTFKSKYAKWDENKKRRESWSESVERSRSMMIDKYAGKIEEHPELQDMINDAYSAVRRKEVLGSQRALQFAGKPSFSHNARIFNCISSYADRPRFFQECMYLLLCGCGTGFSVQKHHIAKLPKLVGKLDGNKQYTIPDSIEGWSNAVGILVNSYFNIDDNDEWGEYSGKTVNFLFHKIRKAGSMLSSGSGRAPGPEPLKKALRRIRGVLNAALEAGQTQLKPIQAYDIIMHASDAVISGGVRRSATICVFSPDDVEMAEAKTGTWYEDNPQRGRSNNSALLIRNDTTFDHFASIMEYVKQFGEPGFVWADDKELIVNPCVTKDTLVPTANGLYLVENLQHKFSPLVDGQSYKSDGFWKTGNKPIYNIELSSGRILRVTAKHKIKTSNGDWVEAKHLNLGDSLKVNNHRAYHHITEEQYNSKDYARGYLLGGFIGDGNVLENSATLKWWGSEQYDYKQDAIHLLSLAEWKDSRHRVGHTKNDYVSLRSRELYKFAKAKECINGNSKQLSKKSVSGSWDYLLGVLSGYFDSDGHVIYNKDKGHCVRLTSNQIENLRNIQLVLGAFGINSKIYQNRYPEGFRVMPNGKGGHDRYFCEATHDLHISGDNLIIFHSIVKFRNTAKQELLNQVVDSYVRGPYKTKFEDEIIDINITKSEDVYDCTVTEIHAFDANGIYVHNCVEISFYCYDDEGNSGWQACNLSTINAGKIETEQDFYDACYRASLIGTLQAGFCDFPYLGEVSEKIIAKEALIGVSMTGIMEKTDICLKPSIQRRGAEIVRETNKKVAELIGINQAARTTCIKPEGTSSCVLGTSSGIHPHHAKRYFRRQQANKLDPVYNHFKQFNPTACEESVWSANGTDDVITFCIEVPDGAKTNNQIDAVSLLETVKSTYVNWVVEGKNKELCTKPWLTHNVSNTITVKDDEWDEVTRFIYDNRYYFCGIALLPISGDKDYPQAPFTAIYLPHEIVSEYGDCALFASGLITKGLELFDDDLWHACSVFLRGKKGVRGTAKRQWIEKCERFARKYLNNDKKRLTYLMKDVYNWKLWVDLRREYVPVDYSTLIENEDNVEFESEAACAGGRCEI